MKFIIRTLLSQILPSFRDTLIEEKIPFIKINILHVQFFFLGGGISP